LGDTFSIDNEAKDLRLALGVFGDAPLSLAKTTYELFLRAQQSGWGARDIGRLAEALGT
jgi:3-hydroxyisobutyrate dehydrogenase-like beta-hydroxyacid dehydrogenase